MRTTTLTVLASCSGLAACSESIPNPSETYKFEEERILRRGLRSKISKNDVKLLIYLLKTNT
ncbi:hypothetical protein, partial [Neisseria musculi]|uniref:hypothetical protein n=1 Tax=Neisseria musculi TaxID=1815583 RepID=UPI00361F8D42